MTSIPLYRSAQLRRIEAAAADQPLMERAGYAAADLADTLCASRGGVILILAGPGNNGGDAFATARVLRERFFDAQVIFFGNAHDLPLDAAESFQLFVEAGGTSVTTIPEKQRWSLIIDGLFGIGLRRKITEPYATLIRRANLLAVRDRCPLLALDCPSGLNSDTGMLYGATVRASHTITFIGGKPGLLTGDGPDHCGQITIAELGLAAITAKADSGRIIDTNLFAAQLKPRLRNSHKGLYGNAGVVGGARGMGGAVLLAARAALRLGSGRVYAGMVDADAPAFDNAQPELMLRTPEAVLATKLTALACGPGLGTGDAAGALLESACALKLPLLLDADALNIVAGDGDLQVTIASRSSPTLLTPHPAEAARLLGCDVATIQADRLTACLELATRYNALIALKGCGTIVADPDGSWFVNTSGNPGLASAGSGDVLCGIITALLAQNWLARGALLAGVHLHGAAADHLVATGYGPVGLTAGELIDSARYCINQWISAQQE